MRGPYPAGTPNRDAVGTPWEAGRVVHGQWYRVVKAFADADGDIHPIGECWMFQRSTFFPYDEEYVLFVHFPDGCEWSIVLRSGTHHANEYQILDRFTEYVSPIQVP